MIPHNRKTGITILHPIFGIYEINKEIVYSEILK